MAALQPIARARSISPAAFWGDFVCAQTPVVVSDCFADREIARLDSLERIGEQFGDLEVAMQEEYSLQRLSLLGGLMSGTVTPESAVHAVRGAKTTLRAWLRQLPSEASVRSAVRGDSTPEEMRRMLGVPGLVPEERRDGLVSELFVANGGNVTRLHFDIDLRHFLMFHLAGRKRYLLIAPSSSWKLNPIFFFSGVFLEEMSAEERQLFLSFIGAREAMVEPGETLFVPAAWWHHVEYVDAAASVNLRFSGGTLAEFFSRHVHADFYAQNVFARLFADGRDLHGSAPLFERIFDACRRPYPSAQDKYRAVKQVLADVYRVELNGQNPAFLGNTGLIEALPFYKADYQTTYQRGLDPNGLNERARSLVGRTPLGD